MMEFGQALLAAGGEVSGYISIPKAAIVLLMVLGWARALTWIDKDAVAAHLQRQLINAGLFGAGLLGVLLFLLMPGFLLGFVVLFVTFVGGLVTYFLVRKSHVGLDDLWKDLENWRKGKKKDQEPQAVPGQVQLILKNGAPMAPPPAETPQRVAYDAAQSILTDALRKNAERIDVRPVENFYGVQVMIDGVAYNAPSLNTQVAGAGIALLKQTAGMDLNERRKPQTGSLKVALDQRRRELEVQTAGSTAGEFLRVVVDPKQRHEKKIEELGLLPDQLQILKTSIQDGTGVVLVTAPKTQGLSTLLYAILRGHDAFLTHIQSIERNCELDIEGVTQNRLAPGAPAAEELKQVDWVISQQPDTIMADSLIAQQSARSLIQFAGEKRAYVGMRFGSTFDALASWRKLVGDDAIAMKNLRMVIAGRIVRRLCTACKVAYAPDPGQLRKLNFDPARVQRLYSARTQPMRDQKGNPVPCNFCQELRFKGRFGVYEILIVDDEMRQAAAAGAAAPQLMKLFRKQRGRLIQEVALSWVEAGETSVQEVLRVMRGTEETAAAQQPAAATRK